MHKLRSTWLPFIKGDSIEQNMNGATDRMNELIAENDLQVVNVETVYRTNWIGRVVEPCGLRVWCLYEAPLSLEEIINSEYDKVNS